MEVDNGEASFGTICSAHKLDADHNLGAEHFGGEHTSSHLGPILRFIYCILLYIVQ